MKAVYARLLNEEILPQKPPVNVFCAHAFCTHVFCSHAVLKFAEKDVDGVITVELAPPRHQLYIVMFCVVNRTVSSNITQLNCF